MENPVSSLLMTSYTNMYHGPIIMFFREEMAKEMSDLLARWVEGFVVGATDIHNQKSKHYPLK